jgi:adenylate kinase family enzyme
MQRIVVTGSTGSGKTTLARDLADGPGLSYVELDALYWDAGWTAAPREVFRTRADAALPPAGCWVADGNYRAVRDISWGRADTLLWLDYPLTLVFWRLARRTLWRGIARVELYNGNRERLREHLLTRQSLFLWLLKTHRQYRREYPAALAQPEYAHLRVERFRRPSDARIWIDGLLRRCPAEPDHHRPDSVNAPDGGPRCRHR